MAIKSLQHSSLTDNIFYRSMLAGNTAYEPSDEDILAEEVLTSSQASVTFSSLDTLAAGYQHLQIRTVAKSATKVWGELRVNGDSGANYSRHELRGNGSSVTSYANASYSRYRYGVHSNVWGASVIDLLDPFETTKNKTFRAFSGWVGADGVQLTSGAWYNTTAISSITLFLDNADLYQIGSRFTLIGLK